MKLEYQVYYPMTRNIAKRVKTINIWLESEIGTEFENWEYEWGGSNSFWFVHEEDKVKFILKWL